MKCPECMHEVSLEHQPQTGDDNQIFSGDCPECHCLFTVEYCDPTSEVEEHGTIFKS